MELLAQHGTMLPPNMQGLTNEQVEELHLQDEWAESCVPSGGSVTNPDPVGRRNGIGTDTVYVMGGRKETEGMEGGREGEREG